MFKPHIGNCNTCSRTETWIVIKAGLCQYCNHEKKQSNTSNIRRGVRHEINERGNKKGISKVIRRVSSKKPTGEREVFQGIADNLRDRWNCFVCGRPLGDLTASNFAHVLPKALNKYPLFKLNPDNIRLLCHDSYGSCHHRFDKEPRSTLTEPMWQPLFDLEAQLKEEYKQLKLNSQSL